ncbi:MAG: hypothetical protein HY073_01105, partial [Deltaproteobacteria bacterium]|nr:hypothetical protein [Deltaproteobacteria bacterium]
VPINSSTFDVTLVGTGTFINGTGKGTLANTINDSRTGIVTIQATIKPPTK